MKTALTFLTLSLASILTPAVAQDSLQIGYFAEWPLPAHYGQISGAYDESLAAPTVWTSFNNSNAMYAALETGAIKIALSQGLVPFLLVANDALDFKIVDIAVSYPSGENCCAHPDLKYSPDSPFTLSNTTAALAVGTLTHFNLKRTLENFGADPDSIEMLNMPPAQAAAALKQGKVDIACGWGPALQTLEGFATPLLSEAQKQRLEISNYDTIVIRSSFGRDNPKAVARFLQVTANLNASFNGSPVRMITDIATAMNMTTVGVTTSMQGFRFPSTTAKLGDEWLNGGVQDHLNSLAEFFVAQGTLNDALDSYDEFVDASYLKAALELPLIDAE